MPAPILTLEDLKLSIPGPRGAGYNTRTISVTEAERRSERTVDPDPEAMGLDTYEGLAHLDDLDDVDYVAPEKLKKRIRRRK